MMMVLIAYIVVVQTINTYWLSRLAKSVRKWQILE